MKRLLPSLLALLGTGCLGFAMGLTIFGGWEGKLFNDNPTQTTAFILVMGAVGFIYYAVFTLNKRVG